MNRVKSYFNGSSFLLKISYIISKLSITLGYDKNLNIIGTFVIIKIRDRADSENLL
jgi:hypothetical protein